MADHRPGLLLMSHGDFPGNFFTDPRNRELYEDCLVAMRHIPEGDHDRPPDDDLTMLSHLLASSMSSQMGVKGLELSYLMSGGHDIEHAITSACEKAPGTIVCAGAAGLMMPGHGTREQVPGELLRVQRKNPLVDIRYTGPCLDADITADIVGLSTGYSLGCYPETEATSQLASNCDDLSVILVSAPKWDFGENMTADFARAAAMLSSRSSRWHDAGICSETSDFMENVSARLLSMGFSAVEAGYIDFASPGIEDAALRLIDKGASHIVVTGVPALLHRHPLSIVDPDAAVKWLRAMIPYATISYLKPEPAFIARLLSGQMVSKVLEAKPCIVQEH
jgi:hypothetical protein